MRERHGWEHDLTTDAEGRFELRELEPTGVRVPIEVHGDWLMPERLAVPCGDEPVDVRVKVVAHAPATDFVFGISLFNANGVCCYGTNTFIEEMDPETFTGEATITYYDPARDYQTGLQRAVRQSGRMTDRRALPAALGAGAARALADYRLAALWAGRVTARRIEAAVIETEAKT